MTVPDETLPPAPFGRAYWVVPEKLMAGCYPGSVDPDEARERLRGLLNCCIRHVINLMSPDERSHSGVSFVPYEGSMVSIVNSLGVEVSFERLPVRDLGVPTRAHMIQILDRIDRVIEEGKPAYIHCWGGRGRTGTVVGCHDEYLLQAKTNQQYVVDLYETFLNRQPRQEEIDYWVGLILQGLSRNVVLNWFAYSDEFKLYMEGLFGSTLTRPECNLVNDFYRGFLNRLPDSGGFIGYRNLMRQKQCEGPNPVRDLSNLIAQGFMESQEYGLRARSNAEFVEDCYNGILRRGALPNEINYWLICQEHGCGIYPPMSRQTVLGFFTSSNEFQIRVDQVVIAGCLQ